MTWTIHFAGGKNHDTTQAASLIESLCADYQVNQVKHYHLGFSRLVLWLTNIHHHKPDRYF